MTNHPQSDRVSPVPYEEWEKARVEAARELRRTTPLYLSAVNRLGFAALAANGFEEFSSAPSLEQAAAEYAERRRERDALLRVLDGEMP